MGIIKEKVLSSGISGDYWRIVTVEIDVLAEKCTVRLAIYLSYESRVEGATPIKYDLVEIEDFFVKGADFGSINLGTIYEKIKTSSELKQAEDKI